MRPENIQALIINDSRLSDAFATLAHSIVFDQLTQRLYSTVEAQQSSSEQHWLRCCHSNFFKSCYMGDIQMFTDHSSNVVYDSALSKNPPLTGGFFIRK